jgi:hypothetical protein
MSMQRILLIPLQKLSLANKTAKTTMVHNSSRIATIDHEICMFGYSILSIFILLQGLMAGIFAKDHGVFYASEYH